MNRGPIEQGEFATYTLAEVANDLGITTQDTVDPVRFLRDLPRRRSIPFVRIGRTIKLRPENVRLLAEQMILQPAASTPGKVSHSQIFGIAGVEVAYLLIRRPLSLRATARLGVTS